MGLSLGGPSVSLGPKNRILGALGLPGASDFAMRDLWGLGEQGAWYDPSDFDRYMTPKGPELAVGPWETTEPASNPITVLPDGRKKIERISNAFALRMLTPVALVAGRTYAYSIDAENPPGSPSTLNIRTMKANGSTVGSVLLGSVAVGTRATMTGTFVAPAEAAAFGGEVPDTGIGVNFTFGALSVRELTNITTATLFQDAAGTTPVTAMEQPVGLMLDKRLGLVETVIPFTSIDLTTVEGNGAATMSVSGNVVTLNNALDTDGLKDIAVFPNTPTHYSFCDVTVAGTGAVTIYAGGTPRVITLSATPTTYRCGTGANWSVWLIVRGAAGGTTGTVTFNKVGYIVGNHASQPTTAAKPVLSARVNKLVASEFAGGVIDAPIRGGLVSATAFDGFGGGIAFGHDGTTSSYAYKAFSCSAGVTYTFSVYVKMDDGGIPVVGETSASGDFRLIVEGIGLVGTTATPIGGAIYRISVTLVATGSGSNVGVIKYGTQSARTFKVTGYQLEVSSTATRYQRVNTATDYDWVGFPMYLKFDGVDDFLQTGSIDFTTTDKMTVVAGVRKNSDAATGMIVELSSNSDSLSGGLYFAASLAAAANYEISTGPSTARYLSRTGTTFPAGTARVQSAKIDLAGAASAAELDWRINGAAPTTSISGTGASGNFGNYPFYIGRRGGTSLPFNGYLYSLIVRGALSTTSQIVNAERAVASKTGVTLA